MENRKARKPEAYQAEIRARLNELKGRWGLSEIARRTETPLTNVHRYMHEGKIPSEFLSALVDAFQINPAWLIAGAGGAMLSEVEPATAKLGGNLLELVEAMNAVSRMRLGALAQQSEQKTLRSLGDALDTYERLREKINAQSRPILRELLERMRLHQSRMELQRAGSIRTAAVQVSRFCDDEELVSTLDSLQAMDEHLRGHVDNALNFHFKVLGRKLRDGGLRDPLAVEEAGNFALALRDSGRFVEGWRITEAALHLTREEARGCWQYAELEVIAGSFQVELGQIHAGHGRILRAIQVIPASAGVFAQIMRLRAELIGGWLTLEQGRKSGQPSRATSRLLIRHAALLEDGPELSELARRNIGSGMNHAPVDEYDSQRCVLLAALTGGNTRDGLARFEALVRESPPRVNSSHLREAMIAVHRAQVARLCGRRKEQATLVQAAEKTLAAVPPDRSTIIEVQATHARNVMACTEPQDPEHRRHKGWLEQQVASGYIALAGLLAAKQE